MTRDQLRRAYIDLGIDQQDPVFVHLYVPISVEEMQTAIVSAEAAKQLAFGKSTLRAYKSRTAAVVTCKSERGMTWSSPVATCALLVIGIRDIQWDLMHVEDGRDESDAPVWLLGERQMDWLRSIHDVHMTTTISFEPLF